MVRTGNSNKINIWIIILSIVIILWEFVVYPSSRSLANTIWYSILSFPFAYKCSRLAMKINKSRNWAYIIGFLFSIIGLIVYYGYYQRIVKQKLIKKIKKVIKWVKNHLMIALLN